MSNEEIVGEALRLRQAELLRSGSLLAVVSALDPAETSEVADVEPEPPFADGYGQLSRRLYASYHELLPAVVGEESELINGENPVSGFDVMTRILSFGPKAYIEYCQIQHRDPTLLELTQILRNSYETVSFLMSMDGDKNDVYELALALKGENAERPDGMFIVTETKEGTKLLPSDARLTYAAEQLAAETAAKPDPLSWRKCPARGAFGYRLWQRMIDLAADDPELLEADLLRESVLQGLYPQQ